MGCVALWCLSGAQSSCIANDLANFLQLQQEMGDGGWGMFLRNIVRIEFEFRPGLRVRRRFDEFEFELELVRHIELSN